MLHFKIYYKHCFKKYSVNCEVQSIVFSTCLFITHEIALFTYRKEREAK